MLCLLDPCALFMWRYAMFNRAASRVLEKKELSHKSASCCFVRTRLERAIAGTQPPPPSRHRDRGYEESLTPRIVIYLEMYFALSVISSACVQSRAPSMPHFFLLCSELTLFFSKERKIKLVESIVKKEFILLPLSVCADGREDCGPASD